MRSKNLTVTVSEGQSSGNGLAKRAAPTVTQTMTYSNETSGVRSFRLEVPQHTARGRTLNPLTVVMHSCTNGYWQGKGCNGKVNRDTTFKLYKGQQINLIMQAFCEIVLFPIF